MRQTLYIQEENHPFRFNERLYRIYANVDGSYGIGSADTLEEAIRRVNEHGADYQILPSTFKRIEFDKSSKKYHVGS